MKQIKFLASLLLFAFAFAACTNVDEPDNKDDDKDNDVDLTVLLSENFGTELGGDRPGAGWPMLADYTGFQKEGAGAAQVLFTAIGNVDLRGNLPSKDYDGSSGANNVFLPAAGGASMFIKNIALAGAEKINLSFGTTGTDEILSVAYRVSGSETWSSLKFDKDGDRWNLVEFTGIELPAGTNTIHLRFSAKKSEYGVRIDDVVVSTSDKVGTPIVDVDNIPDKGEDTGGDESGGNDGEGSKDTPYSVTQVLDIFESSGSLPKGVWVNGYIVGGIKTGDDNNSVSSNDNVSFGTSGIRNTAVLIADSKDVTDYSKCVAVNLPVGAIRSAVNLLDNSGNLHKKLSVEGNLARYFAIPGVRDLTDFELEGGGEEDPDVLFSETFAASQGDFTIVNVLLPEELDHVWYYNAQFTQMAAGSFANSRNYKSEAWLISPAINLSSVSSAIFSFEHAGKQFGAPTSNLTIQVSTTYNGGEIKESDWTKIEIPNHLADETNTFKSAGDMDLTPYCGKSDVRIAFKYTSTDQSGGNWYVKNVVVK